MRLFPPAKDFGELAYRALRLRDIAIVVVSVVVTGLLIWALWPG